MINMPEKEVLRIADTGWQSVENLFDPSGLHIERVAPMQPIPGSHWGDEEAGLIRHTLYAREDTPVHSLLHEACHWLLMSVERREHLHTDAKGSALEEMAVCYLQILLSEQIPGMGCDRMFLDMDRWGYSFRLGSSRAWFEQDAQDASAYLADKLTHTYSVSWLHVLAPVRRMLEQHDNG
jgi:hypothetical protein